MVRPMILGQVNSHPPQLLSSRRMSHRGGPMFEKERRQAALVSQVIYGLPATLNGSSD